MQQSGKVGESRLGHATHFLLLRAESQCQSQPLLPLNCA